MTSGRGLLFGSNKTVRVAKSMTVVFQEFTNARWRRPLAVLGAIAGTIAAFGNVATAQQPMYVYSSGYSRPSVIVDLSVLDKLGPAPTLPGLLRTPRAAPLAAIPGATLLPPPARPVWAVR